MKSEKPAKKKSAQAVKESRRGALNDGVKISQSNHVKVVSGLVIALLAILLYANTLSNKYALDDYPVIYGNSLTMKGVAGIPTMLKTAYWYGLDGQNDFLYRPLSLVTFALEWEIAPNQPWLGHLTNIILYAWIGFLLFYFLSDILKKYSLVIPFAATLLFIAHPLHTEVVANIKSRDELLCFLFLILSGSAFYKMVGKKSWGYGLLTALYYFFALLAKEIAITFLVIFPLVIYFFSEGSFKNKILYTGIYAGVAAVYLIIRANVITSLTTSGTINVVDNTLVAAPDLISRLATAFYILGLYIKLLIFPHPLSSDYSYPQIPIVSFGNLLAVLSLLIYTGLFVFALLRLRKKHILSFAILFYLIPLSLVANVLFLTRSTMADRFLFIPSLGFCIAIVYLLMKSFRYSVKPENFKNLSVLIRGKASLFGLIAVVLVLYSFKIVSRNKDWKNDYSLFSTDSKISSRSSRIHFLYANHLIQSVKLNLVDDSKKPGYLQTAEVEMKEAVRLYPEYFDALFGLGELYTTLNDYPRALESYQQILNYSPNDSKALNSVGNTYLRLGNREKAFEILSQVLIMYPNDQQGYNNIGSIYFDRREYDKAIEVYKKATELNPSYTEAYKNLGSCYGMLRQFDTAIIYFQKAAELDPYNPEYDNTIAATYLYKGDSASAKIYSDKAQQLMLNAGRKR